jgi:hypothetical protein
MKNLIKDWIKLVLSLGLWFSVIIISMYYLFNVNEVTCLFKHHTLSKMPYNYKLITNGKTYKFIYPNGDTNGWTYSSRAKAVTTAWFNRDFKYQQELFEAEQKLPWKTVE